MLYEIVLNINPRRILEVGCGGGDHLRNLIFFNPKFIPFGVDRSEGQIATLGKRHPNLGALISVSDITLENTALPRVDLVYTQAVLMHISETNGLLMFALKNILEASNSHVVLMENWGQHNFLILLQESVKESPAWQDSHFYFVKSRTLPTVRELVLSKNVLPFERLDNYDDLLQGTTLIIH